MHPLVVKSLQCFLRDTYGEDVWRASAEAAGLSPDGVALRLSVKRSVVASLVEHASRLLHRCPDALLEDMGTYLVSHPNTERVRRLLRFAGQTFEDFLYSLDDLPGRVRLAVGDLHLPPLELLEDGAGRFRIIVHDPDPAFAAVLTGCLRALADDYGALVLLDALPSGSAPDHPAPDRSAPDHPAPKDAAPDGEPPFPRASNRGAVTRHRPKHPAPDGHGPRGNAASADGSRPPVGHEPPQRPAARETTAICVHVLDQSFAVGRAFSLSAFAASLAPPTAAKSVP